MNKYYLRYQKKDCGKRSYIAGFDNVDDLIKYADHNCKESYEIIIGQARNDWLEDLEEAYYKAIKRAEMDDNGLNIDNYTTVIPSKILSKLAIWLPILIVCEGWIPEDGGKTADYIIRIPLRIIFFLFGLCSGAIECYSLIFLIGNIRLLINKIETFIFPIINIQLSIYVSIGVFIYLVLLSHILQFLCYATAVYIGKEKNRFKLFAYAQVIWGFFAFAVAGISLIISLTK